MTKEELALRLTELGVLGGSSDEEPAEAEEQG
jgi:hypothetical protein